MKDLHFTILIVFTLIAILLACSKVEPLASTEDQVLDGVLDGLSYADKAQHGRGDAAFTDQIFTKATGLGPVFVATSCASCHAGDGKGHPFSTLTRFGQIDSTGNHFNTKGGPQLQDKALPGYIPEHIPAGATFSKFIPPAATGLGFLELVSDADILAMTDPDDVNGDGIRGLPNWNYIPSYAVTTTNNISRNGKYICRFGKKASVFDLLQQTANAYNQDIGVTSAFEAKDVYSGLDMDPEISSQTIHDVVFYLRTLKAPVQRNGQDKNVMAGKQLFIKVNCSGCHRPELKTGISIVSPLSNKTFAPYTDLLLHEMGHGLDDGYTEGSASTGAWRTPPLWGLGLSPNSQGGRYYLLHDGRARSIGEAIQLHGGEAENSKNGFNSLTEMEKQKVVTFLESL